jgi:hypothetical protein
VASAIERVIDMYENLQPGWYEDPSGEPEQFRYWNGEEWTQLVQDAGDKQSGQKAKAIADTIKTAGTGALTVLIGLFGVLVCIAIGITALAAIATFVFGMGDWRLGGIRFTELLWLALRVVVILVLLNNVLFVPIVAIIKNIKVKKLYHRKLSESETTKAELDKTMNYIAKFWNIQSTSTIISSLLAVAIALIAHDPMIESIGNPWADIIAVAIMLIGGSLMVSIFNVIPFSKLKKEAPDAFESLIRDRAKSKEIFRATI